LVAQVTPVMAKARRNRRAKNKLENASTRDLIPVDPPPPPNTQLVQVTRAVRVARAGYFNAELEEAIEIIARDRVYRMMLARARRLLAPPASDEGQVA